MRYYWLKFKEDFFDSKRIKKLRQMAGGDTYLVIYLKMQLKSLKTGGVLEFTGVENEFADELALDLDERPDDVRVTLLYLLQYGLCECSDNVHYVLPWVSENTGSEGDSAKRMRELRGRKSLCDAQVTQVLRSGDVEKEKEKDTDIEKDKKGRFTPPSVEDVRAYCLERNNNVDPQTFVDFYTSKDWMIGKNKMRDWKAAVRTWEKTQSERNAKRKNTGYANRVITMDQIMIEDLNEPPKEKPKNPALRYSQTPISETDFNNLIVNLEE